MIQAYSEVGVNGTWEAGLILPSRPLVENILVVDYLITGVPSPGQDSSDLQTLITVDDDVPVVKFSTIPLSLDDEDLEVLQFAIQITEDGGMPEGDLMVNWAFIRNNLIMNNGQSSSTIPYISNNSGIWTYVGSLDFTQGVNVSLEDGDELIWWIDVVDRAGNTASGTGLSIIDAMNTDFTVLSYDVTVTNIEISLADGTAPRGNEVVEGTELGVVVHVRNIGTKSGTVTISLMEDMGETRSWLSHGDIELSLSPGQTLQTIPILYETHGAGQQNLYVNVSGMDSWVENSLLPNCYAILDNATCNLNVENDMPRVISQEDAESGLDGVSAFNIILVILLIGAGFAIIVLLRRDDSDNSIFYDDDDDWEEEQEEEEENSFSKLTPDLPTEVSDSQDVANATMALDGRGDITKEATIETVTLPTLEMPTQPEPTVEPKKRKSVKRKKSAAELEKQKEEKLAEKKKMAAKTAELMKLDIGDLTRMADAEGVMSSGTKEEVIERLVVENMAVDDETFDEVTEDESSDDNVDFSSMTLSQLKDELRTRGLSLKGKKAELIARLEE
jgi:hypothetical protein